MPTPRGMIRQVVATAMGASAAAEMWAVLSRVPADVQALSWATSKQKHHILWAEPCTPDHLRVGADGETISYQPSRDAALREALVELRTACTREEILSGQP